MEWLIRYGGIDNQPLYDCRNNTAEQWTKADGVPHVWAGIIDIVYGVITELLYFPCLFAMSRKEFLDIPCYKIMFVLGIVDMCAIVVNSLVHGFLLIEGAVYCTHPITIYIVGAFGLGLWCAACMVCLILIINRLMDIWKPHLGYACFHGYRTWLVLAIPLIYGLIMTFFTPPLLFTSKEQAWFFESFTLTGHTEEYQNLPHTINNLFIVVVTCLLYGFFCIVLLNKYNSQYAKRSKTQYQIFIQSSIICMINLIASIVYVIMQVVPVPSSIVVLGHICWQLGHGSPAVIYICMNKTLRAAVMRTFFPHGSHASIHSTTTRTPSRLDAF